jgi:hypothetical protein
MASIFITYGMLAFPFLFGLASESSANEKKNAAGETVKKHTYWQWVLLGFTIVLGLFVLRYIRVAVKWKEAKQYMLNKMGIGGDMDTAENVENRFDYYWKSVLFFPGWLLNYFFFPQSTSNLYISYIFVTVFLGYTVYYANYWQGVRGGAAVARAFFAAFFALLFSIAVSFLSSYYKY